MADSTTPEAPPALGEPVLLQVAAIAGGGVRLVVLDPRFIDPRERIALLQRLIVNDTLELCRRPEQLVQGVRVLHGA